MVGCPPTVPRYTVHERGFVFQVNFFFFNFYFHILPPSSFFFAPSSPRKENKRYIQGAQDEREVNIIFSIFQALTKEEIDPEGLLSD